MKIEMTRVYLYFTLKNIIMIRAGDFAYTISRISPESDRMINDIHGMIRDGVREYIKDMYIQ